LAGFEIPVLVACLALLAGTLAFIFLIDPDPGDSAPRRSQLDQLLERRDAVYENLRDLKFEYRAGKFSPRDFEETRQALENEAALVLTEIERVTGSPSRMARRASAAEAAGPQTMPSRGQL
jgi:hypothetical protein